MSTRSLSTPVAVYFFPAKKGEGHQGRLATPGEIEEQKQKRAAEEAGVDPFRCRSESDSSMETHTSPATTAPEEKAAGATGGGELTCRSKERRSKSRSSFSGFEMWRGELGISPRAREPSYIDTPGTAQAGIQP